MYNNMPRDAMQAFFYIKILVFSSKLRNTWFIQSFLNIINHEILEPFDYKYNIV